ncbi:MAG: adenylate/guanylate cyclase domain-containing protein [Methylocystis sp.]|uniref:adenylate/guanylate cyclase domain-containing protein n=1 Tax=Methylocystis sp. TaxID=1911079 RepID=UPI003DA4106A
MFSNSIKRKIMGIALALIVLMAVTSVLSLVMVRQVGERFDELAANHVPAYGSLGRAHIRSLERALALRRMIIEALRPGFEGAKYEEMKNRFVAKGREVESEVAASRAAMAGLIGGANRFEDQKAFVRLDSRLEALMTGPRRFYNEEVTLLLAALDAKNPAGVASALPRVDRLRDEINDQFEAIRADMLALLRADSVATMETQQHVMAIAVILTLLAAALGVVFSTLVSDGVTSPVRRLLEGARAVEAGRLDHEIAVTTQDEIGHLTQAFNRMVEQLRLKERILDTFGHYVDPRVVQGLIDKPSLAVDGQRRVMTILFCDVAGFTGASERMTPQGLVKILNSYFSTMSAPIRENDGIIDKYIGDAIMAYWGPPFNDAAEQTRLACLTAVAMLERLDDLRASFPELIGVRAAPISFDLRVGIATGEALVGSIGSEQMMNYTVIGETVNFASRLEGACKHYGVRALISEATARGAADVVETREIDIVALAGQERTERVFEIMGRKGELSGARRALCEAFGEGLAFYRAGDWTAARSAFSTALAAAPDDGPTRVFLRRLDELEAAPAREGWDGTWRYFEK